MTGDNDPRVFFAAERTLLAWLRTGLTIVGLGFVVSRFGLFLRLFGHHPAAPSPIGSTEIGVGLVVVGGLVIGLSAIQHGRFCRTLPPADRPRSYWIGLAFWVSILVAVVSVLLAAYLIAT